VRSSNVCALCQFVISHPFYVTGPFQLTFHYLFLKPSLSPKDILCLTFVLISALLIRTICLTLLFSRTEPNRVFMTILHTISIGELPSKKLHIRGVIL